MEPNNPDQEYLRARWRGPRAREQLDAALLALRRGQPFVEYLTGLPRSDEIENGRDLRGAPLAGHDLSATDLSDVDLEYADLHDTNFHKARLVSANLSSARATDAQFTDADLSRCMALFANFEGANLCQARLVRANLAGANLRHANLRGANLSRANAMGADLTGADLFEAVLDNAKLQAFAQPGATEPATPRKAARDASSQPGGTDVAAQALDRAIKQLYEVFARYEQPAGSHASPHAGISAADMARLYNAPLARLSEDDLATYARRALSVWGDVAEFKHYLPRILHLIATGRPGWVDADLFLAKLDAAGWHSWAADERDAVRAYLDAVWRVTLLEFPRWPRAAEIMRGMTLATADIASNLALWRGLQSMPAVRHLADLVLDEEQSLYRHGGVSAKLWHPGAMAEINRFLLAPETVTALEAAFLDNDDAPPELANASDILNRL